VPLSSADEDAMIVNFYKPGHIIEDMWFQLEIVEASGMDSAYYQKIGDIVEASYQLGWDPIYGGILREVDINGKKPDGRRVGDPLERLIDQSWNSKLWWVHSETLYTTLLCYLKFKEERFLDLYEQCKAYSFKVFPNPNQEIGEWIQILDQDNKPMEKVVGLPVKDPYHIIRNFLKIVEICME
jgi:N-acylglucosamine 2-epimerase